MLFYVPTGNKGAVSKYIAKIRFIPKFNILSTTFYIKIAECQQIISPIYFYFKNITIFKMVHIKLGYDHYKRN